MTGQLQVSLLTSPHFRRFLVQKDGHNGTICYQAMTKTVTIFNMASVQQMDFLSDYCYDIKPTIWQHGYTGFICVV